ncbi:Uncharacterized protein PECH_008174 [Penicillium ucsense]|uniref:Protein kinase domain-containing protein n=1 Tax=Penicillium ucsense TaxID=2839758 RepID=A0A8J8VXU8_9EURO|nr:Uncharacterized protein PECM_000603 [Penicillium ucsense]KAF7734378.1 Uncharacterized protein PECH_008174 [Penicillium ucsense]
MDSWALPAKPAQNAARVPTMPSLSHASSPSTYDDPSSGLDSSARRRLQKAASTTFHMNPPNFEQQSQRGVAGMRSGDLGGRRLSIKGPRAPQGPRPQESSRMSKPPATDFHSEPFPPSSMQASTKGLNNRSVSIGNLAKVDACQQATATERGDFLSPISFDDFHNSIMAEPSLNHFPMPGSASKPNELSIDTSWIHQSYDSSASERSKGPTSRRKSEVNRFNGPPPTNSSSPTVSVGNRNRRQSLAQNAAGAALGARTSRKSISSGAVAPTNASARRASLSARKASVDTSRLDTNNVLRTRTQNMDLGRDEAKVPSAMRSLKAKSFQPAPREPRSTFLTTTQTIDHTRSSSTNAVRTPVKNTHGVETVGEGTAVHTTPSSSSKRVSTMPHATGLGARTISPTDARRMKRMSVAPTAPPMPHTPPMQTEPLPTRPVSTNQSPSLIPRKSVTPSSTRTTPDPNRKSYSSGLSLSSTTSYNSIRNSSHSLQPRLSQNFSSSRLPTPKPRTEQSTKEGEEVPPVPAIPKAYESPKSELDAPVFPTSRKSSLTTDFVAPAAPQDIDTAAVEINDKKAEDLRGRATKTPDSRARNTTVLGRKGLQPLKLPPLNLLPLGTPMTTKIEALRDREADERNTHTPSHQILSKTPSTPMTASKANFWQREDDEKVSATQIRSSTSHFGLSSISSGGLRTSSSTGTFGQPDGPIATRNISPYASSTLPKPSSDFSSLHQQAGDDYTNHVSQARKINGPRPQTQSAIFSPSSETLSQISTPSESESTTVGANASLKDRLNVARLRRNSKAQLTSEIDTDRTKYDNMPPPKLPASATWNNLSAVKSSSPVTKTSYLKPRRQASVSSITKQTSPRKPSVSSDRSLVLEHSTTNESVGSDHSQVRASSYASPVHRIISTARSSAAINPRSVDVGVDADIAVADEEMRRLGAKRKDFEIAAKQLDELRRKAEPKDRVGPAHALKMANLNIFERGEIIDYRDIFFCGTQNAKKHVGDLHSSTANFGYDDDRGDYSIVIGDHLAYRYEVVDVLGKGSFGQVVRCVDHKTGALVAVKIIRNKKRFHQQALIEVNLLKKLKEWDSERRHSVVAFDQSFYFRGHLCISTELLGMNLYEFIKAHDFRGFSLKLIRRFTKQMLSSLVLLHAKKVIHCDLKPENILLVHPLNSEIRVIDFGSSCFENEKVYTYIQSRFYRSPEVILGMSYGMPIDMWSLGCILAELLTGYPIFPGENEQEQLACIMEVFGPPEKHLIEKSSRKKLFFDSLGKPRLTVSSKGRRRRPSSKELRQVLKCDDDAFLDFISRCLRWDPARRLTPHDALKHEFITGVKLTARPRVYGTATPSKRGVSASNARPLPEPPSGSLKNIRTRDVSGTSPVKGMNGKRHSTVTGLPPSSPAKRGSTLSAVSGTGLPRASARSISGKPDLATAAAATSLE